MPDYISERNLVPIIKCLLKDYDQSPNYNAHFFVKIYFLLSLDEISEQLKLIWWVDYICHAIASSFLKSTITFVDVTKAHHIPIPILNFSHLFHSLCLSYSFSSIICFLSHFSHSCINLFICFFSLLHSFCSLFISSFLSQIHLFLLWLFFPL